MRRDTAINRLIKKIHWGDFDDIMQEGTIDAVYKLFDLLEEEDLAYLEDGVFHFIENELFPRRHWEYCLEDEVMLEIMETVYQRYDQRGIELYGDETYFEENGSWSHEIWEKITEMINDAEDDGLIVFEGSKYIDSEERLR